MNDNPQDTPNPDVPSEACYVTAEASVVRILMVFASGQRVQFDIVPDSADLIGVGLLRAAQMVRMGMGRPVGPAN